MKKILQLSILLLSVYLSAQEPVLVRHDFPGSNRFSKGNYRNLTVVNNTLFFVTDDGNVGSELFKSDGTEAGTVLVKDIYPGAGQSKSSKPTGMISFNNQLFFFAYIGDTNNPNSDLWKSDGTEEGTVKIKEVTLGFSGSRIVIENTLYFEGRTKHSGDELWKTDGTAEGTVLVKTINPNETNKLGNFVEFKNLLYFSADDNSTGSELWKSDGTVAGTVMIKDINSGATGSSIDNMRVVGDELFFSADDGTNGAELWKTDGTEAGTVLVKDIKLGASGSSLNYFRNFNGALYFSANDGTHGAELWKSDGTEAGTVMLKDIRVGSVNFSTNSSPKDLIVAGNKLYFIADDGLTGTELWKSDGTEAGTVLIEDKYPGRNGGANNNTLVAYGDYIIYKGYSKDFGQEPWISDGTIAGTKMLKDINPGKFFEGKLQIARGRITNNNIFYFTEYDGVNGSEPSLWKLNLNTLSLKEPLNSLDKVSIYPNPTSDVLNFKVDNQQIKEVKIYNLMGKEVFKTFEKENINISQLSSGMYLVHIKTETNTFTKKIIKK